MHLENIRKIILLAFMMVLNSAKQCMLTNIQIFKTATTGKVLQN